MADKQRPPNGYAAKFATPYCIAAAFIAGGLGLDAFTDDAVADAGVRALASKVRYRIDPDNPYPRAYTGHISATLRDGRGIEERQPHLRGGAHEPLTRAELEEKFARNAGAGGWPPARLADALALARTLFDGAVDLGRLARMRRTRPSHGRVLDRMEPQVPERERAFHSRLLLGVEQRGCAP